MTRWSEEHRRALRSAGRGVRRCIVRAQVRFGFDNATREQLAISLLSHQQLAEELPRDDSRMPVKENARHQPRTFQNLRHDQCTAILAVAGCDFFSAIHAVTIFSSTSSGTAP